MGELTTYEKFLLRGMVRQRLLLLRELDRAVETLALEAGPEEKALSHSCNAVTAIRDQTSDLETLVAKLS